MADAASPADKLNDLQCPPHCRLVKETHLHTRSPPSAAVCHCHCHCRISRSSSFASSVLCMLTTKRSGVAKAGDAATSLNACKANPQLSLALSFRKRTFDGITIPSPWHSSSLDAQIKSDTGCALRWSTIPARHLSYSPPPAPLDPPRNSSLDVHVTGSGSRRSGRSGQGGPVTCGPLKSGQPCPACPTGPHLAHMNETLKAYHTPLAT